MDYKENNNLVAIKGVFSEDYKFSFIQGDDNDPIRIVLSFEEANDREKNLKELILFAIKCGYLSGGVAAELIMGRDHHLVSDTLNTIRLRISDYLILDITLRLKNCTIFTGTDPCFPWKCHGFH